jgi:transcription elongation factor Elf1
MTRIAEDIADGKPNDFNCPYCNVKNLFFSFTVLKKLNMYGLFIVCKSCGKAEHFTFSSRPLGFSEELVFDEYQRLEDEAN